VNNPFPIRLNHKENELERKLWVKC
jgi:hypothetical protein